MKPMEISILRAQKATLKLVFEDGEQIDATTEHLSGLGYVVASDVYREIEAALVEAAGLERHKDITSHPVNAVRYLCECAINGFMEHFDGDLRAELRAFVSGEARS